MTYLWDMENNLDSINEIFSSKLMSEIYIFLYNLIDYIFGDD